MSVAAIESATAVGTGAQNAIARIAELQTLVARAHAVPHGPSATASASFQTVLDATGGAAAPFDPAAAALPTTPFSAAATPATTPVAAAPAAGIPALGGEPTPYDGLIADAAQRHGLDPALLKGLIRAESNFDPSVTSSAGAAGLVQLMPGTAASLGVTDRSDPAQSIEGGARYLKQQLDAFGGDVTLALAAYNAGPGAVSRYGGVPPYAETRAYVQKVQGYADEYRVAAPVAAPPVAAAAPAFSASTPTTGSGSIT